MNKTIFYFLLSFILLGGTACKKDSNADVKKIVTEWVGKTIQFPEEIACFSIEEEFECPDKTISPYKILIYTDSVGCMSCKLHLSDWLQIIEEANKLFPGKVTFHFYYSPKNQEELIVLFRKNKFNYPVYLDHNNTIDQLNDFPFDHRFRTFLLDHDNKVLMLGNPASNIKVWELYKQLISEEKQSAKDLITTIRTNDSVLEFGEMKVDEEKVIELQIENTGNSPFIIKRISTSCGCTSVSWEKQPVNSGKTTSIQIKIMPDEEGFFSKTISIYCNIEEGVIHLPLKGSIK